MSTLVLVEHEDGEIRPATFSVIAAAAKIGGDVDLLVAGSDASGVAQKAAAIAGVNKVMLADNAAYAHELAENLSALVVKHAGGYSHILFAATAAGKNVMPRVAALLDVSGISDIIEVKSEDTFVRPIYAGNALATVKSSDAVKVVGVRTTAFDAVAEEGGSASVETVDAGDISDKVSFVGQELSQSDRPELTSADIVVSGGRGMQSGENFSMLDDIAGKLNAAVGASRAAVDAGFVPNEYQVGQTGKVVAPDLYLAVGISGAIQHLAGMKDSKVIVAINKDEEAPIFQVADYGLVADLFDALPELSAALDS
ncbi:electron transfer flavoprotein subunit alpha/FixB family protein [Granulosicoccus antarcticus]|uniref:Electron transfer flavoprotein subunit alpha n=1 Tax=Granulosicoccus antarcticus IMCC3135 TaxID=1192854 RepID=A0A2Z2NW83_9GAMM|nr:FAD-binding protein [Granulosicoccus antarcticus]ASJ75503.1 Electron transfer flavoprotein subunit alpha [Granulosicoccus antarcticus IMCC3135]